MSDPTPSIKSCRYCQHYKGEGRRGGQCQILNALVQGSWKPCKLAIPPFGTRWEESDNLVLWPVMQASMVEVAPREVVGGATGYMQTAL